MENENQYKINIWPFIKRNKKHLLWLIILIPIMLSIFFRMQSAYLPVTDTWAENSIYSAIQNNIANQVDAEYPNLPSDKRSELINERFNQILDEGVYNFNGFVTDIDEIINLQSEYYKGNFKKDSSGNTYLLAIDPYYYYRLTQNYINNGYDKDYINSNGQYCDSHILAGEPYDVRSCEGEAVSNFHILVNAYTYKIMKLFNPDVELMSAVFYVPIIISTLAVIPVFFICKKFSGYIGALVGSTLVAIHPVFISRTPGGFADTDAYGILFSVMVAWFFIEAFYAKDWKRTLIWGTLAGMSIGLFAYTWSGWIFIFDVVVLASIAGLGYIVISSFDRLNRKEWKLIFDKEFVRRGSTILIFIITSAIFITLFTSSFAIFSQFYSSTVTATQIKDVATTSIWPNVYTTVAELNPANLPTIMDQISMNNALLLLLAFIGLGLPLLHKNNNTANTVFVVGSIVWYLSLITTQDMFETLHLFYGVLIILPVFAWVLYSAYLKYQFKLTQSIILLLWFVVIIYAGSKGVRFVLLLVPPFAISVGLAVGIIHKWASEQLSKMIHVPLIVSQVVFAFAALILLIFPVNVFATSYSQMLYEVPNMNDQWYTTLDKINKETAPDSIINSWWDFGHWFAAVGNRSVTLDGGRQTNPAAHWLGKLMLTNDEDVSMGILRYLDCGNNQGYYALEDNLPEVYDSLDAKEILDEILSMDYADADSYLTRFDLIGGNDKVLQYTHCSPPENYFITSEDMVGKSGVWAHFGSWDFTRALQYKEVHQMSEQDAIKYLMDRFSYTESEAADLYNTIITVEPDNWIAPWPGYAGTEYCTRAGDILTCPSGFVFDFGAGEGSFGQANQYPHKISFIDANNTFKVKEYSSNLVELSSGRYLGASILKLDDANYELVLMDSVLADSMFTRLFYFENQDKGLEHFEIFSKVTDITGQKIIVWKVKW